MTPPPHPPFQKSKMSPPFIGLSGKQKYWKTLLTGLYIFVYLNFYPQSILILEEYLQKWYKTQNLI